MDLIGDLTVGRFVLRNILGDQSTLQLARERIVDDPTELTISNKVVQCAINTLENGHGSFNRAFFFGDDR